MMKRWAFAFMTMALVLPLCAGAKSGESEASKDKLSRVTGMFKLVQVEPLKDSSTRFSFDAIKPETEVQHLIVETLANESHLKVGVTLRLSASLLRFDPSTNTGVASQILLQIPSARGVTPIWVVSKETGALDLSSARFLEMSLPLSDYHVL